MKLKYDFETIDMGDEYISVPISDHPDTIHGVFKLNKEGLEIFDLLKTDITEESIVDILSAKYDNSRDNIAAYVRQAINILCENNVIDK